MLRKPRNFMQHGHPQRTPEKYGFPKTNASILVEVSLVHSVQRRRRNSEAAGRRHILEAEKIKVIRENCLELCVPCLYRTTNS